MGNLVMPRPFYGRRTSSKPSHTLPDITRWWYSRPIDEPTTSADVVTVTALPRALSAAAASVQLDFASETLHASVRAAGGGVEHSRAHMAAYGGGTVA
jgi:hypothetical protein